MVGLYETIQKIPPKNTLDVQIRKEEVRIHHRWAIATTIMVIATNAAFVLIFG